MYENDMRYDDSIYDCAADCPFRLTCKHSPKNRTTPNDDETLLDALLDAIDSKEQKSRKHEQG